MAEALLLDRCGYLILAVLVMSEQIGIPLPAVPALLGVGSLAADGRMSLPLVLGTAAAAGLTTDLVWFELGRRRGPWVLDALRRVSGAPDSRVRHAENLFRRYAVPAVLIAKFIPGLTSVTPPLAGLFGIGRGRFLLYDLTGILLWAGIWSGLGYVFSDAIEAAGALAAGLGATLGLVIVTIVVGYVLLKHMPRRWRVAGVWMARLAAPREQGPTPARVHGAGAGSKAGDVGDGRGVPVGDRPSYSGGIPACGNSVRPPQNSTELRGGGARAASRRNPAFSFGTARVACPRNRSENASSHRWHET